MDDIWEIGAWAELENSFPDDDNGSRILFTTRIQNVAGQANPTFSLHCLRPFSDDESLELLQKKLFHKSDCPPKFFEIGKSIVKICKGLPLAVVVIAGLLAGQSGNLEWWEQTIKNLGSRVVSDGCKEIMELSYKHLPEILKPCFFYFGAFQEDKVIRAQKLTKLWISEGFIQNPDVKMNLEDVAKKFLEDLAARSLVIVTQRSSNGGIKACQVHDLLRDFCLEKGENGKFFQVLRGTERRCPWNVKYQDSSRLCVQRNCGSFLDSNPSSPSVRSLIFSPTITNKYRTLSHFVFSKFDLLTVLDLEEIELPPPFPERITLLVLLQYLALWIRDISIPPSLAKLSNLETLRIKRISFAYHLPDTIWLMKKLRHVIVGRFSVARLIHYDHEESFQLDNVQTFASPVLSNREIAEKLLRRIPNVRKLKFFYSDSLDQFPVLNSLSKLESLHAIYSGGRYSSRVLTFPSTLKKLTLGCLNLEWNEVSALQNLPNLGVLKLLLCAFDGETWDVRNALFSNLKFLKLSWLGIQNWILSEDSFPSLQRLVVERCDQLQEIPSEFGYVSTLSMIEVRQCSSGAASSARRIRDQQHEMSNEDFEVIIES